jgi:hypothetical protein
MANKDMVVGAMPFGRVYELSSYEAEGTIYPGDFVKKHADGTVEQAAAGNALLGVAMNYATAGQQVLVADHPDQKFMIQADESDIDAQADIGLCADIVVASANTTYRRSGMELDSSGIGTGTAQLKILEIVKSPDNALGAQVKVVVRINEHQLADSSAGV